MRHVAAIIVGLAVLASFASNADARDRKPAREPVAQLVALPDTSAPTMVAGLAKPPIGWVDFCQTHPQDCQVATVDASALRIDAKIWTMITRLNREVNASIEQVEDIEQFGVLEKWVYPVDGKGDCEDIVLEKRRRLMQAGIPRSALLITVVRDEQGDGHAVLTLRTDRGDYVLDNKTSKIKPWLDTPYGFVKRQSQQHPDIWVTLDSQTSPVMTAKR
jgi:predicted transglutaminase-like cysteine proteinase